jgi:ribosome-associated translation inhibitor RaiA
MNTADENAVITVQSSNIHLGDFLPARARRAVLRVAAKYFRRLTRASVYFSREGRTYRCTVNMEMGALRIVTGEGRGFTCYLALSGALRKAAKQLRRIKRALRDDKPRRFGWGHSRDGVTLRPTLSDPRWRCATMLKVS